GGCASMYGFWRLGVIPAPSGGADCVTNGLATATTRKGKKVATAAKTGTTPTMRARAQARFRLTAPAPKPVRISNHRSKDPSCPPQNAEIVYAVGSATLVVLATYANEKSFRSSAESSTAAATAVDTNAATSAFCAERASRRRPWYAAYAPATSAYSDRPTVTGAPAQARPRLGPSRCSSSERTSTGTS